MATDISPTLLKELQDKFEQKYTSNKTIQGILAKVDSGLSYKDANIYAENVGDILAETFSKVITSDTLPDGRMYYNIAQSTVRPMLENNHQLVSEMALNAQRAANIKNKIGLNPVKAKLNTSRLDGIVDKVSSDPLYENVKWVLNEPVVNFTQAIVDESIRLNSEMQSNAGLSPKIVRKIGGNCCDWCANLVGEYVYPNVPKDVYRRHSYCRCTVEYVDYNGLKTNVHSKQSYQDENAEEIIKRIKSQETFKPAKTTEEAEEFIKKYVDDSRFGAVGVSYKGVHVDVANVVNKTISSFYEEFDVDKFGGILAPAGNTKLGKAIANATAAYSPVRNSFLLNRNSLKTMSSARTAFAGEQEALSKILAHPERYDMSKFSRRTLDVIEMSKSSGRVTYPKTIEQAIDHELGHSLENKVRVSDLWPQAEQNMSTYANKISGYAGIDVNEYIAESFSAYRQGEKFIDPIMIKIFNSLRR